MSLSASEALIGQLAVEYQILTEDQVEAALRQKEEQQIQWDFGEYLVAQGVLSPEDLLRLERVRAERVAEPESAVKPESAESQEDAGLLEAVESLDIADALDAPAAGGAEKADDPQAEPQHAARPSISYEPGATLEDLLRQAAEIGANDLHLHSGARLRVRIDGVLRDASADPIPPMSPKE